MDEIFHFTSILQILNKNTFSNIEKFSKRLIKNLLDQALVKNAQSDFQ
jgi:hypothetical protein